MYGVEAFPTLTKEEVNGLNSLQHQVLCEFMGMPKSTPYAPLLMEVGISYVVNGVPGNLQEIDAIPQHNKI